jgi:hypothetical protein
MPPARMLRHPIILSLFILLLLPIIGISESNDQFISGAGDNFSKLSSDLLTFADESESQKTAGAVLITNLRTAVQTATAACPPDFSGLLNTCAAITGDVEASLAELSALQQEQIRTARLFAEADKKNDARARDPLLFKLKTLADQIAGAEARAIMLPEQLDRLKSLYMPYVGKTCSDNSVYIDGTYCIDKYEMPDAKDAAPKAGLSFTAAKSLCESAGKRLCTGAEWMRACVGPACGPNLGTMQNFNAGECNAGLNGYSDLQVKPSGSLPVTCDTPEGVSDIYGNAWEWVNEDYKTWYKVAWAGATHGDQVPSCDNYAWAVPETTRPYFGVRCCSDPSVPPPPPIAVATGTVQTPAPVNTEPQ